MKNEEGTDKRWNKEEWRREGIGKRERGREYKKGRIYTKQNREESE